MSNRVHFEKSSERRMVLDVVPEMTFLTHPNFPGALFIKYHKPNSTCNVFNVEKQYNMLLPICDTVTLVDVDILVKESV
jgi:hypothetical protein